MHFSNSSNSQSKPRILIIGAGPTGLTTAACIQKQGITVDVFDRKKGPNDQSKALSLNPVAKTQLDIIFGGNTVANWANPVSRLDIMLEPEKRFTSINLDHLDWINKTMLIQPQQETENELLSLACEHGANMHWNTTITEVEETPQCVRVVAQEKGGSTFSMNYDYVVGCDGKYSLVREALGTRMLTLSYDMYLALADFELDCSLDERCAYYFVFKDTFFVFVPFGAKKWRVVVKHDGKPSKDRHVELVTKCVEEKFGRNIFVGECLWFSQAPLYISYADKLQSQRLFIAGDAAHLYSPIGGTGMNTGITDAINLAWKLGFTVTEKTRGNNVIQSYQEERIPVIRENAAMTDQLTQAISRRLANEASYQKYMPLMSNRTLLKHGLPAALSGYTMSYAYNIGTRSSSQQSQSSKFCSILTPLMCEISMQMPDLAPQFNIFYLIKDIDVVPQEYLDLAGRYCGARSIFIAPVVDGTLKVSKYHSGANSIVAALPKSRWEELSANGEIQMLRPDGMVAFQGAREDFLMLCDQLSTMLNEAITEKKYA